MRPSHRVLLLAGLLALSACSRKRYKMPSGSMWPGIPVGETVTADTSIKNPARGDVFVFKYPEHPETSFVKRIVGLPGDRVEMKGQALSINGKPVASCTIGPFSFSSEDLTHEGELVLEGAGYVVFYEKGPFSNDGAWTVAPGQFWAMGDNRSNSHDSRMWFGGNGGGVPQALLEGKVGGPKAVLPPGASALAPSLEKCKKQLGVP
jgi:signal peptidase I